MIVRVERLKDKRYIDNYKKIVSRACSKALFVLDRSIRYYKYNAKKDYSFMNVDQSVRDSIHRSDLALLKKEIDKRNHILDVSEGKVVYLSLDSEAKDVDWKCVYDFCLNLIREGKKVYFCVDGNIKKKQNDSRINYIYNLEDIENLIKIDSLLKENGNDGIKFHETTKVKSIEDYNESLWNLNDVLCANMQIDDIVNTIKEENLSPFETMLYIHKFITENFMYSKSNKNIEEDRMLPGIFKTGYIVCAGYSSLVKAIIDRLNNPNLKCELIACNIKDLRIKEDYLNDGFFAHCEALIYINDEKYRKEGFYINDTCWDSIGKETLESLGFSRCLVPLHDLFYLNDYMYFHKFRKTRNENLMRSSHNSFTRAAKHPEKRKIEHIELVKKFISHSPIIEEEIYYEGLLKIAHLFDENEIDFANKEIKKSKEKANKAFSLGAINCFVASKEKIKR